MQYIHDLFAILGKSLGQKKAIIGKKRWLMVGAPWQILTMCKHPSVTHLDNMANKPWHKARRDKGDWVALTKPLFWMDVALWRTIDHDRI